MTSAGFLLPLSKLPRPAGVVLTEGYVDAALERKHLAESNRHIAEATQRIILHRQRLTELERDGHDTSRSRDLLETMRETLTLMQTHRRQIERALATET